MTDQQSFESVHPIHPQKIPYLISNSKQSLAVPETKYFKQKAAFDRAVGEDFIDYINNTTHEGNKCLVGLAHGQSPSGAYQYIFDHYDKIEHPELIRYTFTNSRLKRQRGLEGVMDARAFVTKLLRRGMITKDQILGRSLNRDDIEAYGEGFNANLKEYLDANNKDGFDYVFLTFDSTGRVAGVSRNSTAFQSTELVVIVEDEQEKELTGTPYFLSKAKRIAFLATKSDKRRPLAWLYRHSGRADESPSFLRYIDNISDRMTVFIDDKALTWPQLELTRKTAYGPSLIRLDMVKPYDPNAKVKLPIVLLVHGFLGLNSFDSILTSLPTHDCIGVAMHYGSIPYDLPQKLYSQHVVQNIDTVIEFFGSKGHPVYLFDHSMGNTYFMLMDKEYDKLRGVRRYLKGRIGANPFFGEHAKHAFIGFLDSVLLPALSYRENPSAKAMLTTLRRIVPFDTKKSVRRRSIRLMNWLIRKQSAVRDRLWKSIKTRILYLMTNMNSVPHVDRIPIERALSRLPAKLFVIQVHAALEESKSHDKQTGLPNMAKKNLPILILKSEKDSIAKFETRFYKTPNVRIVDVTNEAETDRFREHLFHMVNPDRTSKIIMDFINEVEESGNWRNR